MASLSVREIWQVLRRRWWVVAIVTLAAGLGALGYSLAQPTVYRAQAEVIVLPTGADWELSTYLEARLRVLCAVLLALPESDPDLPRDLPGRMHVQPLPQEGRVVIQVQDGDPQRAADMANLLAGRLEEWVEDEFNRAQGETDRVYVRTLVPAQAPTAPAGPRHHVHVAAGLLLGLLLGLPLAFAWDALDDTLGDVERDAARLGLAVWPAPFPGPLGEPAGEEAAAWHRLHAQLRLASAEPWRTLAVIGVTAADLPAALPAHLGAAIAREGRRVLLVDTDFGRPALHEALGLPATPGLADWLQAGAKGPIAPAAAAPDGLHLLPAGEALPPVERAVAWQRAVQALPALADAAEVVLLRLPDPPGVPESLFLAAQADAVLLVARAGRGRGSQVRRALALLRAAQARVLGLALWPARRQP